VIALIDRDAAPWTALSASGAALGTAGEDVIELD